MSKRRGPAISDTRHIRPPCIKAMLPLLRESSDARIVNVSSGVGSLASNADHAYPYHAMFGPVYPASKAALNAVTLAITIELESTDIKVNLVSPAFTKTNLNGYQGTESVEDGSREVVRVAYELGSTQWYVLYQVANDGPTMQRDLGHMLHLERATMSAVVAWLAQRLCGSDA